MFSNNGENFVIFKNDWKHIAIFNNIGPYAVNKLRVGIDSQFPLKYIKVAPLISSSIHMLLGRVPINKTIRLVPLNGLIRAIMENDRKQCRMFSDAGIQVSYVYIIRNKSRHVWPQLWKVCQTKIIARRQNILYKMHFHCPSKILQTKDLI